MQLAYLPDLPNLKGYKECNCIDGFGFETNKVTGQLFKKCNNCGYKGWQNLFDKKYLKNTGKYKDIPIAEVAKNSS